MPKTILFLVPYPLGQAASQRFRFEQYLAMLRKKGYSVIIQSFWPLYAWPVLYKQGYIFLKAFGFIEGMLRRAFAVTLLPFSHFVFIHREVLPIGPPIFEWLAAKVFRKKIIYDYDDAIWLPNTSIENKFVSKIKWHSKVKSICRWSYRVSCGNEYLAAFARTHNKNVLVNPSTIDTDFHKPVELVNNDLTKPVTIGWTGSHSTIGYLDLFEDIFMALEKANPDKVKFLVISDKKPDLKIPSFQFLAWRQSSEIEDLQLMDIGIMPLPDDPWTRGKCGFKILQYMALGIPAVASLVGANTSIIKKNQNGFLCETQQEWLDVLQRLVESSALRKEIGRSGRENVLEHYSLRSNLENFLSLF